MATELELQLPDALAAATEHQERARLALAAALAAGPSHAYLFTGPRGAGKRAAARAFAADIISAAADDEEDARRRALLDPSPHPDLVWLAPTGSQHLVESVREQVIRAAAYRPYESSRRVFVIEQAEVLREESQNALLKTLEEPPEFAHLILVSSEPELLLETITSRCTRIEFAPLPAAALEAELTAEGHSPEEAAAGARLAAGDLVRARFLLSDQGRELRAQVEAAAAAALAGDVAQAPWRSLLDAAEAAGAEAEEEARAVLTEEAKARGRKAGREVNEEARRVGRRRRTEVLDLGLELCSAWFRDLVAVAGGAPALAFNRDRAEALSSAAAGLDQVRPRRAVELIADTRRRLELNVSEELALEALFFRLERELS